jgi:DNA polymerase bacteriophage-type
MIFIDFETYSEVNIKTQGGKQYAEDDSTQIICLGYATDKDPVQLWSVGLAPLDIIPRIRAGEKVYAFNAMFDWRIWNNVGVRDFGWPVLPLFQMVDVQALCASYQLPQNLDAAGEALNLKYQKDKRGNALIKLCCIPDKNGEQPTPNTVAMRQNFRDLFSYCLRDVEAMREMTFKLPRQELIPREQEIWQLTQLMNDQGLPIDVKAVHAISETLDKYITETAKQLPTITSGQVYTPNQIARILAFCKSQGVNLPNLQADTVDSYLNNEDLPRKVRTVLELRQELGRSSTAKYKKIKAQVYKDWVYDNVRFHGAGTGRWTGQGFQMHNLPRASVENPDEYIEKFIQQQPVENPVHVAKALIRPMIKAPKGWKLIVVDYSSIENVLLAYAAEDEQTLDKFRAKFDQYVDMAVARFNVPYDQVTKEQRRVGKVIILGCGYGMGAKKFKETFFVQTGQEISIEEAKLSVDAYRYRYPLVKELWNNLKLAATRAVVSGDRQTYKGVTFGTFIRNGIRWLAMQLPTGKALYYMNPFVKDTVIPDFEYMGPVPTIFHYGTNPYTKKWTTLKLIPGRITENLIQATAREVMAQGLLNVQREMREIILLGSVHDEAIGLVRDEYATQETLDKFNKTLCSVDFLPGCPITGAGYISERYKKE